MKPNTPGPKSPARPTHRLCSRLQDFVEHDLYSLKFKSFLIVLLLITTTKPSFTQIPICAFEPIPPEAEVEIGFPDCTLTTYDLKCIRVKFHYLDNDPLRPSNAPGDAFFFDLLKRINSELEPGKIRLTFDYNCIHRGEIEAINSSFDIWDLIMEEDPLVDFDPDAINIYFMQDYNALTPIGSNIRQHAVVGINDFPLIVHEVGHTLGLIHTFIGENGNSSALPPETLSLTCKDITVFSGSTIYCEVSGDYLCDTGIDPLTLDLDEDDERDGNKWVNLNTCTQSEDLVASIPDWCNDMITPWDIPVRNYMSYYSACRSVFTPCQYGRMHEAMSVESLESLILDCEEDPFALALEDCSLADITINSIVTWTNETKYLCPGQRIIITPSGHLILNNTILTRAIQDVPLETCPSLFHELLWDGIYIEGRGANVLFEGSYYHLGGLTVKNGSIVEYSKNGVQGLKGYGKVEVVNSTFRNNMRQFALRDPWPFSFALEGVPTSFTNGSGLCNYSIFNPTPSLILTNSGFEVGSISLSVEPPATTQIMVDFGKTTITNCEISNPNEVSSFSNITAIKHSRGKLSILNATTIDNFNTGIFKAADIYNNCSGRGLYMQNSTVTNTMTALHSTNQFVFAKFNIIKGNIISEGICYSRWFGNHIRKGIPTSTSMQSGHFTIQAPEMSYVLEENLFNYFSLDFYGNNANSNSLCNTWKSMDEGYAVVGEEFVDFPASWGSLEHSAGNRHLDGEHIPAMFSEDQLINYYNPSNTVEEFVYDGSVNGDEADESECTYEFYPISSILFDSLFAIDSINISVNNNYWLYLDSIKVLKQAQIPGSPLSKQKTLLEEIDQIEIIQGDLVRSVLSNLTSVDESIETTWLSRADPGVIEYSELLALWYKRDYTKLDSIVSTISDSDAETLLAAIGFAAMCSDRDVPLDSLSLSDLDTLIEIAQLSYGNYSNIVRNYLNMVYDKTISWPIVENGLIPRSPQKGMPIKVKVADRNFIISPNPNNGCFSIGGLDNDWHPATYQIISSTGSILQSGLVSTTETICIGTEGGGLYFVRIITLDGNYVEVHKIMIQ